MTNGGLKTKIILLVSLPTVLLTLLLAGLFLTAYFKTLNQQLIVYSKDISLEISQEISRFLVNNETNKIVQISNSKLNKPDVRAVAVFNTDNQLISHVGPDMAPIPLLTSKNASPSSHEQIFETEESIRISSPIFHPEYVDGGQTRPKIGYVEIEVSSLGNTLKKYQTVGLVAAALLLCWIAQGLIAYFLSTWAETVIAKLKHAITEITKGKLDTQLDLTKRGPLEPLQQAFNNMGSTLNQYQNELKETLEQATEDVRETLETIEIQNIELDMARKEALEASRIKSEFLASMSHEIRTPLNSIIGFTRLLLKSPLTPRQKDHLDTVRKSSHGLLTIINEILDFSKIEAGKLVLEQAPFNLRDTVDDVIDLLSPLAHEKNLEQVIIFYSDVPNDLIGDAQRIKQVLTNLINNAIKFSDQGTIVVRVILESENDTSVVVRCSVSDKGIGLSEEQKKDLFKAFSQVNTNHLRSYGGTGLGLVISKHLVEKMGGEIGFESEPSKGSTFWFTSRLKIDHAKITTDATRVFSNIKVALFDANKVTALSVSHLLENDNFLHTNYETIEALYLGVKQAYHDKLGYDYAIIGINQSYENNHQLIAVIKEIEADYNCKVVILSNINNESNYQNLLEQNSSLYLIKPITYRKFINSIAELCEENSSYVTLPPTEPGPDAINNNDGFTFPCQVLAVDDNASNLKLICSFLNDLGAEVTAVSSGEKAVAEAKKTNFDLILMDIRMPGMDGMEATKQIRSAEPNGKHVPIIAVTAHAMANEKINLLSNGMNDYITKPIDEIQLRHMINKWTSACDINRASFLPTPKPRLADIDFTKIETIAKSNATKIIDFDESVRLAGGKHDLAKDLYLELISELEENKSVILAAKNDLGDLLERVHKLHGGTRYCGVPRLRMAALQLETHIKQKNNPKIEHALSDLISAIDQLLAWHQENQESFFSMLASNDSDSIRH